jgi:hypothetical protein
MGAFRKTIPTEVSWIGLGVFLLPTLVLSMLARWQLAASIRETSALLLGVAVYFAYMLLGNFLNLRFTYPEVTPYPPTKPSSGSGDTLAVPGDGDGGTGSR